MLCFIDESGDPGLKLESGSSPHFVVALVLFNDNDEALATDQRIGLLRRELRLREQFEFRFNHMKRELREAFLKAVAPYEFSTSASSSTRLDSTAPASGSRSRSTNTPAASSSKTPSPTSPMPS
jgi:hypothetical protein